MKKLTGLIVAIGVLFALSMSLAALAADNEGGTSPTNVNITVVMPEPATPEPEEPISSAPALISMFPVDVTELRDGGNWQIIKTYELTANENPQDIPQESFERGGWAFTLTDILRRESANAETRGHTETVTLDTETKELEKILPLLPPTMEYRADDGFIGILTLDVSSIAVETAGTKTTSHTMTVTREYPHLSSNDTSLIPKKVTDRGKAYALAGVDWRAQRVESIDYEDIPTSYTGVATYTATGYSTSVTGYTTTAVYNGELAKLSQGKTHYIAYFLGEEIRTPLEFVGDNPFEGNDHPQALSPIGGPDAELGETAAEEPAEIEPETEMGETPHEGSGNNTGVLIAVIICVAIVAGGAFYFIKKRGITAMKKATTLMLALALTAALAAPAMAADYRFESGADTLGGFGTPTSTDNTVMPDPMSANARRNKDAALFPPPYGVFSGDIPTGPTSPYHNNLPQSGFAHANQDLPPIGNEGHAPGSGDVTTGFLPATSQAEAVNTVPWHYEDGSIGTLYIKKLNKTIKVYEGESLENMTKGIGHFVSTSAWDGNVGLAGHNRGAAAYFGFVKDLSAGDTIAYTTRYGTRVYEVYHKERISENDFSSLRWTSDNILTLITCVENMPELRWAVQAREKIN